MDKIAFLIQSLIRIDNVNNELLEYGRSVADSLLTVTDDVLEKVDALALPRTIASLYPDADMPTIMKHIDQLVILFTREEENASE